MSGIAPLVRFEHKATWTIKNFEFRSEKSIISRKFDVRCFDVTSFSLRLQSKTDYVQFSVRLHYARSHNVPELFLNSVTFAVYVLDEENKETVYFVTEGSYFPTFSEPESSAVNFIRLEDFNGVKHLHKSGELVLRCMLITTFKQQEYLSTVYSDTLLSLASSLYGMLTDPIGTDMVAVAETKEEMNVHLSVLRNRCPSLFEAKPELKYDKESKMYWYSHMSTPALKLLLSYFYGRVFIEIPYEVRSELRDVARKNKLYNLERQLVDYPVHVGLGTEIVVEEATFKYGVRKVKWDDDDFPPNEKRFTPEHNPNASELVVTFSLTREGYYENYVNVSFKFSNPVEGVPIHLECQFFLLDKKGEVLLTSREYSHTFTNETWSPPPTPPFATKGICKEIFVKKPHALKCVVRLSEMSYENRDSRDLSKGEEKKPLDVIPVFNNLSVLSDDLLNMYETRTKSDMKIFVIGEEFYGHRFFLSWRSGLIRQKLNALAKNAEKKKPLMLYINVDGVAPYIFDKIIRYMYSGKIVFNNEAEEIEFEAAAKHLVLTDIFQKKLVYRERV